MVNAVLLHPDDMVVTVTKAISKGEAVSYTWGDQRFSATAAADIPIYHKMAVKPGAKGGQVIKYGEKIGKITADFAPGDHVHTHNMA